MANAKVRKAKAAVRFVMRGNLGTGGVAADVIANELRSVYEQIGALTAPAVVDAARPEDSPMHPAFLWDDAKAGEQYRLHQARNLIRAVEVVRDKTAGSEPVYVYVPSAAVEGQRGSYKTAVEVASRPDLYAAALNALAERMRAAEAAVCALRDIAERENESDADRMARITLAVTAMQTAAAAVQALH